jgi:ELWxxDGT repeat protein
LFIGLDANGRYGLWVTDGTSAGTSELAVARAYSGGLSPSDITVVGNKALFVGVDASGNEHLWVTDGTAAGTNELSNAAFFNPLYPSDITTLTTSPPTPSDFNVDGDSDILWQSSNGQPGVWLMNGTTPFSEPVVVGNPGPN